MTGAAGAQAAPRYAEPPAPTPAGIPGGFSTILASETVGSSGGTIGPVMSGPLRVTLRVPAGDFPVGGDITLAMPNLAGLGSLSHFPRFRVVGGVGVFAGFNGAKLHNKFISPFVLRMLSALIRPGAIVVAWNGSGWVRVPAVVTAGGIVLSVTGDPAYLVLNPGGATSGPGAAGAGGRGGSGTTTSTAGRTGTVGRTGTAGGSGGTTARAGTTGATGSAIAGATSATTGKPLAGEGLLAGALLITGIGGLAYVRRSRITPDQADSADQ